MTQVEIFFSDLIPEKQDELLAAVGVDSPEEMNWDTFAVSVCDFEEEADDYCEGCRHLGETTCAGSANGCFER